MMAGEKGGSSAKTVFSGMGLGAVFKMIVDGLKAVPSEINATFKGFAGQIGTQVYPALLGVGYICGPRISSYMFAGGVIGWMVLIPLIVLFGGDAICIRVQILSHKFMQKAVHLESGAVMSGTSVQALWHAEVS